MMKPRYCDVVGENATVSICLGGIPLFAAPLVTSDPNYIRSLKIRWSGILATFESQYPELNEFADRQRQPHRWRLKTDIMIDFKIFLKDMVVRHIKLREAFKSSRPPAMHPMALMIYHTGTKKLYDINPKVDDHLRLIGLIFKLYSLDFGVNTAAFRELLQNEIDRLAMDLGVFNELIQSERSIWPNLMVRFKSEDDFVNVETLSTYGDISKHVPELLQQILNAAPRDYKSMKNT